MEQSELNLILEQHKLWIDGKGGICADLTHANLDSASLVGADLTHADLAGADLEGANLTGATLTGANLGGANLTGANLVGANIGAANLHGANLRGANLTGAKLEFARLHGANLQGAILPDISWIIPGCLVQLNQIKYSFYLKKEGKYENFIQDSLGFIIKNNPEEKTFDMLVEDRIIRNIPHWVKYTGLKKVAAVII